VANETYAHWDLTGATPRPPAKTTPLDSAIAFEQYRLRVISRWPEDEAKQMNVRVIQHALHQLESDRKHQHKANSAAPSQF